MRYEATCVAKRSLAGKASLGYASCAMEDHEEAPFAARVTARTTLA